MSEPKEKAEAKEQRPKKPPGYRKFNPLLKDVITAKPQHRTKPKADFFSTVQHNAEEKESC